MPNRAYREGGTNTADLRRGGRGLDFSGYYSEPDINPIAVAMQLLGQEQKTKSEQEARGFEREKFADEQRRAAEALGFEREKFGETKLTGEQARKLAEAADVRAGKKQESDITQKQYEDETARQKLLTDALDKLPPGSPLAQAIIKQLPGMREPVQGLENTAAMEKFMPQLQLAYANKDPAKRDAAIKMLYGQLPEYVRQNAPWQDLNAAIPAQKPGWFSHFGGGGGGPTAPTPQSTDYVPEWQTGASAAPDVTYVPEWQQPTAQQPQVAPTITPPDITVAPPPVRPPPAGPPSALPPDAFPSVEDLIARSQYQAPAPQAAPQLPPSGPPLVTPEVPPEYQPEWQAGSQVNPAVMMPRGEQQINPAVYMPRGGAPAPSPDLPGVPGQGFVDWLKSIVSGGEEQRLPFTYGNPLPPSQPMPTPIPQRGSLRDILR